MAMNDTSTLYCLCNTPHTFGPGVYVGTCAGCGLELVRGDAPLDAVRAEMEAREDDGEDFEDHEPLDIDDDRDFNPYTGSREDDGYDTGYDDYPGVGYDD